MTASTKGIWCAAGEWTVLSTAKANVLVSLRNIGAGYIKTAAALPTVTPSPDETPGEVGYDFLTISNLKPAAFAFSDDTTNVYFYPVGSDGIAVEVVTE